MLPLQSLVLLKEHLDLNYIMKWGWSLLNLNDGSENFVPFTKLKALVSKKQSHVQYSLIRGCSNIIQQD